jgi:thioredoxin reductase
MTFDLVIIGGGPAGLAAALTLGRARRRVLLVDGGARRNAAAERIHGFVTRDGTPPDEFRRIARQQLETYASVEVRDARVEAIQGERGAFEVRLDTGSAMARRILLCTGMVDELPALDGFRELWGRSIFQCPYCHGWEVQDQAFGILVERVELLELALLLRGWTRTVVALTDAKLVIPEPIRERLGAAGVLLDERPIRRLVPEGGRLQSIEFDAGGPRRLDVLFARPPQRQVALVQALGLTLDDAGYVRVDDMHWETSRPGVHAAGDLTTFVQSAILAAASGTRAAAALNHALTAELATSGALD